MLRSHPKEAAWREEKAQKVNKVMVVYLLLLINQGIFVPLWDYILNNDE